MQSGRPIKRMYPKQPIKSLKLPASNLKMVSNRRKENGGLARARMRDFPASKLHFICHTNECNMFYVLGKLT